MYLVCLGVSRSRRVSSTVMSYYISTLFLAAFFVASPVGAWAQAEAGGFLVGGPILGGPTAGELDLITLRDQGWGDRGSSPWRKGTEGERSNAPGFVYVNLPVLGAAGPVVVRNVGVLLDAYGPEQVYLHCQSGQRAAEVCVATTNRGMALQSVIAGASAWGLGEASRAFARPCRLATPGPEGPHRSGGAEGARCAESALGSIFQSVQRVREARPAASPFLLLSLHF